MKKIFISLLFVFCCTSPTFGASVEMDEATKKVCNEVIVNIYQDILKAKEKHRELEFFDEDALFENEYGVYAIVYKYEKSDKQKHRFPFEFGLTVVGQDDKIFMDKGAYAFNLMFPILKLKFAGYQRSDIRRYKFELAGLVNEHGVKLAEHQQKYIPLQMSIKPVKNVYFLYEQIQFEVSLTNLSNQHMIVKSLNQDSLYCLFDNKRWGAKQMSSSNKAQSVLKSGETMKAVFVGEESPAPKEVTIYCSYNMNIQGVHPSASLTVQVLEE